MESIKLLETKFKNFKNFKPDIHNLDYECLTFSINDKTYRSRLAKKTPIKKGYFLALWTKDSKNNNIPYSYELSTDFIIILIKDGTKQGSFLFSKEVLKERGILSSEYSKGKMAFRVYPPWCIDLNKTACKTQSWQIEYFTKIEGC